MLRIDYIILIPLNVKRLNQLILNKRRQYMLANITPRTENLYSFGSIAFIIIYYKLHTAYTNLLEIHLCVENVNTNSQICGGFYFCSLLYVI